MFSLYNRLFNSKVKNLHDFKLAWRLWKYERKWIKMFESLFIDEVFIKGELYYTIYELKVYLFGLIKFPVQYINYRTKSVRHAQRKREKLLIKKIKEYEQLTGERFVYLRTAHNIEEK